MADPAPLIETPDAKAPLGGEADWLVGSGGARLRAALFTPPGRTRGSIVLSGGRVEPIEKYYEVIGEFMERGFVVLTHDWRGQGLSHRDLPDRLKGYARGYKTFLDDYQTLLKAYQARLPKPWVAVGHSMGGCLALLAMACGETRFSGAILSAPMLGIQTGKLSASSARMLARLNVMFGGAGRYVRGDPGKPFADDFESNILTHDRARFARTVGLLAAEPKLALGGPTWGWLDFALRATAYLAKPERLRSVTVPVTIVSAGLDKLVDNAAQAAAARHLPQGKFISIPGAFHEILMETDEMRNIFLRAFDALTGRTAPKPAEAPKLTPATPPVVAAAPKPVVAPAPAPAVAKPAAKAAAKKPAAKRSVAKKAGAPKAPAAKAATIKKAATKPAAAKTKRAAKVAPAKAVTQKAASAKKSAAAKAPAKPKVQAAKKPAPKAAAVKKVATVKAAAKPAARSASAKPAAAKKAAAPKPAAKKPAVRKAPAKKAPAKP